MNLLKTTKINKCRLCNHKKLKKIYNFGDFYVSNFVNFKDIKKGIKAPLSLVYCGNCKLLQLEHSAPQELMYRKFYWYRSGVTQTMRDSLQELYSDIKKKCKLKTNDLILDIGANDGTFLNYFKKDGILTIGCEPAKNLQKDLKKNCDFVINDFWSKKSYEKNFKHKLTVKPKVITAIGMFYDLEDPSKFIKDAAEVLSDDGIFVAQLMCLHSMLKENDLGNICHEHLEFYSYDSLKYLFEKNGLKIFKITKNNVNGGSYRIYCKKNIKKSISYRESTGLKDIKEFINRIEKNRETFLNFFNKSIKENKKIFLYGASTKGNTLLQYYKLDHTHIQFAAERSPEKWGKYTIGSGVKIISETEARKLNPNYFFVMPYSFINEFVLREKKWLKNGGRFILPYPKFKLVK
tara:strand:- start:4767 stop:5984 length:1218 start_codon:yes stop_codon:yes gene_type:complete